MLLRSVATAYVPNQNQISEDARKKLRISRMREQANDQGANSRVLLDPHAGEWTKQQALNQIEMVREIKKRQLLYGATM